MSFGGFSFSKMAVSDGGRGGCLVGLLLHSERLAVLSCHGSRDKPMKQGTSYSGRSHVSYSEADFTSDSTSAELAEDAESVSASSTATSFGKNLLCRAWIPYQ